jgi:hypothetical protein
MTAVRNTRLPQTTGDDQLRPGSSVFHATFSVADQRSGRRVLMPMPAAWGPRNWGQFPSSVAAACTPAVAARHKDRARVEQVFMGLVGLVVSVREF